MVAFADFLLLAFFFPFLGFDRSDSTDASPPEIFSDIPK